MGQVCWRVRECVQLSLCTHLLIDQQFLVDCWFGLFAKVCCRCFLAMLPSVDSGVHVLFDSICVVPVFAPPHLLHHILCAFFAVWKPRTPSWSPDQGPTRSVLSVGYGILFHSFICSSVSCAVIIFSSFTRGVETPNSALEFGPGSHASLSVYVGLVWAIVGSDVGNDDDGF